MSVFRYPGGKTRLLPNIRMFIDASIKCSGYNQFIDAFVGGGSVLCDVAMRHPNLKLVAVEADDWVGSFWWMIATGEGEDEFFALLNCIPTVKQFMELRDTKPSNQAEKAFRAVFFNRTCFSGILTSGPI